MGDIAQKAKDLGVGDSLSKGIGFAENCCSYVSLGYQAYSAGKSVLEYMGFLDKEETQFELLTNQIEKLKEHLDQLFNELEQEILAASELSTRQPILDYAINAQNSIKDADDYIQDPENESKKEDFSHARENSEEAAGKLRANLDYWNRVYAVSALYDDVWSGVLYPPGFTPAKFIWDYRFILPVYLGVISARIIVLMAAGITYRERLLNEVSEHAEKLAETYEKILAGFSIIRPPTNEEMFSLIPAMYYAIFKEANWPSWLGLFPDEESDFFQAWLKAFLFERPGGRWRLSDYVYGAVETYSGHFCLVNYPQAEIWEGAAFIDDLAAELKHPTRHGILPIAFYEKFILKHTLRSWRQAQQLYLEIGLPNLRNTIQYLYSILGKSPPPIPSEYVKYTAWSVREVYSIIPESVKSNLISGQSISLRSMATMLSAPSPVSVRAMFSLNE